MAKASASVTRGRRGGATKAAAAKRGTRRPPAARRRPLPSTAPVSDAGTGTAAAPLSKLAVGPAEDREGTLRGAVGEDASRTHKPGTGKPGPKPSGPSGFPLNRSAEPTAEALERAGETLATGLRGGIDDTPSRTHKPGTGKPGPTPSGPSGFPLNRSAEPTAEALERAGETLATGLRGGIDDTPSRAHKPGTGKPGSGSGHGPGTGGAPLN